jgi:nitrite reductase (NADH) small subunit
MMAAGCVPPSTIERWIDVCAADEIVPDSGACVLVDGQQVAIVRVGEDHFYALDNFDPFSHAFVLSRGIVGDKKGVPMIASPIYKQAFDLRSGQSLDDPEVRLRVWPVRVRDGRLELQVA